MTVHRKRTRKRGPSRPRLPHGTYRGLLADGDDLGQAAEVIAGEARRLAGTWSTSIPDSITVEVSGNTAIIYTDAPAAYPNEVLRVRHPVFGPTAGRPDPPWVTNKHRPFLAPAVDAKAGDAMDRWTQKYERLLEKAGFKRQ